MSFLRVRERSVFLNRAHFEKASSPFLCVHSLMEADLPEESFRPHQKSALQCQQKMPF